MKLKELLTAFCIGLALFSFGNVIANTLNSTSNTMLGDQLKGIVVNAIKNTLGYDATVTANNVVVDDTTGIVTVNDLIVIPKNTKANPGYMVKSLIISGIDFEADKITKDFNITADNITITNIAGLMKSTDKSSQILKNSLNENIYKIDLDYIYSRKTLIENISAKNNGKNIADIDMAINNVDLYNVNPTNIFHATWKATLEGTLADSKMHLDISNIFTEVLASVDNNVTNNKPMLQIDASHTQYKKDLQFSVDAKYAGKNILDYHTNLAGVDFDQVKIKDLAKQYIDVLRDAYVESFNMNLDLDIPLTAENMGVKIGSMLAMLRQKQIDISVKSFSNYKDSESNFNTPMTIDIKGLATINANFSGSVNGKLKLLDNIQADKKINIYSCKNISCINSISLEFVNKALLQKVVNILNPDTNESPEQKMKSYSAIMLAASMGQKDPIVKQAMFALATYLQNPNSIKLELKSKKPVNFTAIAIQLQSMKKANPDQLLDMFSKIFNPKFVVNGSYL